MTKQQTVVVLAMTVLLVMTAPANASIFPPTPPTVDTLELSAYLGQWYQAGTNIISWALTEQFGHCVTAEYTLVQFPTEEVEDTVSEVFKVEVKNRSIRPIVRTRNDISGVLTSEQDSEVGRYTVRFDGPGDRGGDYWVIGLGEIVDDQYQWALVSGSTARLLFVLVRSIDDYHYKYKNDIDAHLVELGFTGLLSRPIETPQDNCDYIWNNSSGANAFGQDVELYASK